MRVLFTRKKEIFRTKDAVVNILVKSPSISKVYFFWVAVVNPPHFFIGK